MLVLKKWFDNEVSQIQVEVHAAKAPLPLYVL